MNLDMKMGLKGRYTITVRKAADESVVRELAFDNLITDSGLNRWGSGAVGTECRVGSGTTAPSVSDNALASQVAVTSTAAPDNTYTYAHNATGNGSITVSRAFRFNAGVAAGTLAEVGIGWATGLFSRALIVDGGGTPTTITILSDEILDVRYTLQVNMPADVTGSVSIGGTSYSYTIRPCNIDGGTTSQFTTTWFINAIGGYTGQQNMAVYSGAIGTITQYPSGTQTNGGVDLSVAAYSNNSKQRTVTYTAPVIVFNTTFRSMEFGLMGGNNTWFTRFQIDFGASITKTNAQVFSLTFTFSWDRV